MSGNTSFLGYRIAARLYDTLQHYYSELPYRLSSGGRAFPVWHYVFEVTRRCNLRCRMCMFYAFLEGIPPAEQKAGELTLEEWRRVIDQTGRMSLITFTGGEPFLRPDFTDILAYASMRTRTHVISNGTLLDEARAEAMLEMAARRTGGRGLFSMGVSLEGPEECHDAIRGIPGAFSRSMAGVQRLYALRAQRRRRFPLIHVTTVIQQANASVLPEMPALAKEIGGDVLNLVIEYRAMDVPDVGAHPLHAYRSMVPAAPRIAPTALEDALIKTENNARSLGIELRMPRMPRRQMLAYYSGEMRVNEFGCRSPWNTLIVGRTGDVFPCWLCCVGNVRQDALKELWNGKKMQGFRRACREGLFPMCAGCCFLEYRGSCENEAHEHS